MLNKIMTVMLLGLILAVGVISCGGGDEANGTGNPRLNPADVTTDFARGGGTDGTGGPGQGGGQCGAGVIGTSNTGACVILDSACLLVQCTDIATPGWCNLWNSSGGFYNATWYSDQTCAQLGY
jgi:hypothetical protein